jgi:hypothetical protein
MSGIAISYRRDDAEGSAGRLYDRLVHRYGDDFVFMDYYSIESGEEWMRTVEEAVTGANVLLAVIGPRWLPATDPSGRRRLDDEHDYVRHEIRAALEGKVPVVPVLVHGAAMVRSEALPGDIAAVTGVQNITLDTRYYDRDIHELYRVVDDIVAFGGDLPRFEDQRTAVTGFVGLAARGPVDTPIALTSWPQFRHIFGDVEPGLLLAHAVYGWFENGGEECFVVRVGDGARAGADDFTGDARTRAGLAGLDSTEATIVAAPDVVGLYERGLFEYEHVQAVQGALVAHAERTNRVAILDTLPGVGPQEAVEWVRDMAQWDSRAAAVYYPWLTVFDPPTGRSISIPPSGHVAGTWARNDKDRGVWAAPANLALRAVVDLERRVTEDERRGLERARINVLVARPGQGIRVWGARTLSSSSTQAEIAATRSVAALGRFIRELTSWAAFERSHVRTWNRLRDAVEVALDRLWRKGAFAGETASDAYYVQADANVNVPELVASGRIRVEFGFALRVPGEFLRMSVEQPSGDVALYGDE